MRLSNSKTNFQRNLTTGSQDTVTWCPCTDSKIWEMVQILSKFGPKFFRPGFLSVGTLGVNWVLFLQKYNKNLLRSSKENTLILLK